MSLCARNGVHLQGEPSRLRELPPPGDVQVRGGGGITKKLPDVKYEQDCSQIYLDYFGIQFFLVILFFWRAGNNKTFWGKNRTSNFVNANRDSWPALVVFITIQTTWTVGNLYFTSGSLNNNALKVVCDMGLVPVQSWLSHTFSTFFFFPK